MYNIKKLTKSIFNAAKYCTAAAALWYATTVCSPAYAQEAPKPPAVTVQDLEKKAEAEFDKGQKAKTQQEQRDYFKKSLEYYDKAEAAEPGDQYGQLITGLKKRVADLEVQLKKKTPEAPKPAAPQPTEESLVKQADELLNKAKTIEPLQERRNYFQTALDYLNQAEGKTPGDQYRDKIAYCTSVLGNIDKLIENIQGKTPAAAPEPKPATPAAQPTDSTPKHADQPKDTTAEPPKSDPAPGASAAPAATPPAQPDQTQTPASTQPEEPKRHSHVIDFGSRIGINHTTKNHSEYTRINILDYIEGKGIYDIILYKNPEGHDMLTRTYAGTGTIRYPGVIGLSITADNTEERESFFMQDKVSNPSFNQTTDTSVRNTIANQYIGAKLEIGPLWNAFGLELSTFDHLQRIITHIDQAVYVENLVLPNGDYSEGFSIDEKSKINTRGMQAIVNFGKNITQVPGMIGLLFDYEQTEISMANLEKQKILLMHFGLAGKINIENYFGLTFIGGQQYLDAQGTDLDHWPATPAYVSACIATPRADISKLINLESKKPFNIGATAGGALWYLENRNLGGGLFGAVSLGQDDAPIDFLNDLFYKRGQTRLGLRRELSDRLAQFDLDADMRILPFAMHPPKDWAIILFGYGGCFQAKNLNNEDVQANFGNAGIVFKNPYVSVGGTVYYLDDAIKISQGIDVTFQMHKLGNMLLYFGGHTEKNKRRLDDIIEAEFGLVIR